MCEAGAAHVSDLTSCSLDEARTIVMLAASLAAAPAAAPAAGHGVAPEELRIDTSDGQGAAEAAGAAGEAGEAGEEGAAGAAAGAAAAAGAGAAAAGLAGAGLAEAGGDVELRAFMRRLQLSEQAS